MSNWRCPGCGATTYHYDPRTLRLVCDFCPTPVSSEAELQARLQFDRTVALARQHLTVGNYKECKNLIKPLTASYPADKQLYLLLLACSTESYTVTDFIDYAARAEAAGYWDKLERLNCVNGVMLDYARRCMDKRAAGKKKGVIAMTIYLLASGVSLIMVMCSRRPLVIVVGIIMAILCLCPVFAGKNRKRPDALYTGARRSGSNPFV